MYTLTLLMILSTAQPAANNDAKSFLAPEPTYQNASPEIGDVGAAFRSAWAPGYGQFSKERPTQGIFVAFSTYGAAAFTAISTIIAFQQFDAFNNFTRKSTKSA